uniref:MaoC family dehydratase n=1 Tax=Ningiella ruwaisensis TaxID=2364274 RepID=UPI00109EE5DE|nr:MaoC family dehydratase [Ningiella ruwaisensis]
MDISQLNIGSSVQAPNWLTVDQNRINEFASATGDYQWIHIDEKRCKQESPFKTTIAHGFLTAALMPKMFGETISIDSKQYTMLNYGIDTLRYLEPVRVNDKIRFTFTLESIEQKETGRLHRFNTSVSIQGRDKPALIGTFLMLLVG